VMDGEYRARLRRERGQAPTHGEMLSDEQILAFTAQELERQREHRARRERIATAALTGMLAQGAQRAECGIPAKPEWYAEKSVMCADALIAELNKTEPKP
jgi:hypothetical protein